MPRVVELMVVAPVFAADAVIAAGFVAVGFAALFVFVAAAVLVVVGVVLQQ